MKFKIIVLLMLFSCTVGLTSCSQESSSKKDVLRLPINATVLKNYGNDWVEFELDGNRYLFYKEDAGYKGHMCITQITEE